ASVISISNRSALYSLFVAPRALRIDFAVGVTVVSRIRVDDAAHRAMLGCDFGLDASPASAITADDNRSPYGDAKPLELLVIITRAVIHVHQRAGYVAINRIGVVRRKLFGLLVGGRIAGDGRLLEPGHKFRG